MTNALEIDHVSKSFGLQQILFDVVLSVAEGERHAIIGPNGAGKSTLFHVISGRIAASKGTVRMHSREITGMSPSRIARLGLARSFQITNVFPNLSVRENLLCASLWSCDDGYCFWRTANSSREAKDRVEVLLQELGLKARAEVPAGLLSYSDQRSLEIGMSVASNPSVVLLDEPTAGMSRTESERAVDLVTRVTAGRTLLMVEHDMSVVFGLADRISVLVNGSVLVTGAPDEVRNNREVRAAYLGDLALAC